MCFAIDATNVSLRGVRTDDGVDYWSVFDFINVVCEKKSSDAYRRKLFHRLIGDESEQHAELLSLCKYRKFSGDIIFS